MGVKEASATYQVPGDVVLADKDVPRGYKRTDVGVIPQDWDPMPLGTLARGIYRGASPRPIDDPIWFDEASSVGWVRISDVTQSSRYLFETTQRLSQRGIEKSRYLPSGALIMSICATVGRPIETCIDACIHDGFVVFDRPEVDQDFLYHVLSNLEPQWGSKGQTGSQMNLNTGLIKGTEVPVPHESAEQRAIAEVLSNTDALIESLQQLIAKKRALKQGAIQALLSGRQRLPEFSGEWKSKPLSELFRFSGGFSASRAQLGQDGHLYLHYGDIHGASSSRLDICSGASRIPRIETPLARVSRDSMLEDGDVVFVDASEDEEGVSKHIVVSNPDGVPFIAGLHTIVAKGIGRELEHAYRRYCFHSEDVKQQFRFFAVGTKVQGVSKGNIGKIELRFPSANEQIAIATVLSDMDAEIDALETRLAKSRDLKAGMMQSLLTGRIRLPLDQAA